MIGQAKHWIVQFYNHNTSSPMYYVQGEFCVCVFWLEIIMDSALVCSPQSISRSTVISLAFKCLSLSCLFAMLMLFEMPCIALKFSHCWFLLVSLKFIVEGKSNGNQEYRALHLRKWSTERSLSLKSCW